MEFNTADSLNETIIRRRNLSRLREEEEEEEELREYDLLSRLGNPSGDDGDLHVDCSLKLGLGLGLGLGLPNDENTTTHPSSSITFVHSSPHQQVSNNHGLIMTGRSAFHSWNLNRLNGLLCSADVADYGNGNGNKTYSGDSSEIVKRCAYCGKTDTPLWRNGPNGRKTLCNACGIRFKKQEKKALRISEPHPSPKPKF
ncbi:GATA zinc finger domain-containing protein 16-like [Telopea speciosissima]|uniref:GATA zinc finger domain-containing protein 16-like n=1 Tax=Telopea speciosissima TaxID=54955 RepID=UPI001CC6EC46|nr:GATA zinc finger domain-containing protein 16-like [Telopea speciosissima]